MRLYKIGSVEIKNMRRLLKVTNACEEHHLALMTDPQVHKRFRDTYDIVNYGKGLLAIPRTWLLENEDLILSSEGNLKGSPVSMSAMGVDVAEGEDYTPEEGF